MQQMDTYHWAQDKIEEVTLTTRQHREAQACERRLRQMAARREKAEKRAAAQAEKVST